MPCGRRCRPIGRPRWACASRRSGTGGSGRSPTSPCGSPGSSIPPASRRWPAGCRRGGRSTSGCCRPRRRTRRRLSAWGSCRRPSAGWRASPRPGRLKLLSRRLEAYNEGVGQVIAELEDRPQELARLLREAERRRDGGARDRPDRGRGAGHGARRHRVRGRAAAARPGGRGSRVAGRRAARERRGATGRGRLGLAARGLAAVRCRRRWSPRARPRRRSGSSTPIDRGRGSAPACIARGRATTRPRGS